MKNKLFLISFFSIAISAHGQQAIHDRAIEAQQERMVFKQWDQNKFYPKPNRILGIPINPTWYLTWALHPDYPKLDRRPLSATGEQTQRLGLAVAMQASSAHYKQESDSVKNLASAEMARISGALSSADPLFQLYYKQALQPLDNPAEIAFENILSPELVDYMTDTGAYAWYLNQMKSLSERYGFARTLDMERGQRILMYHRIMLDMRGILKGWQYKLDLSANMLVFRKLYERKTTGQPILSDPTDEEETARQILSKRKVMK